MRFVLIFHLMLLFASATILRVPAEYISIQEGIDAAIDGDTVLVANGHYHETIQFDGKAITVASYFIFSGQEEDILSTIIDASQSAGMSDNSVVSFVQNEGSESKLIGFTITGGTGTYLIDPEGLGSYWGGGVLCMGASPTLSNLYIRGNTSLVSGGGMYLYQSSAILSGLKVISNTATYGAGVGIRSSSPSILMSVIADNTAEVNSGGIDLSFNSVALFDHLTVTGNQTLGEGLSGGLGLYESSNVDASNSIFYGNLPEEVDFVSFGAVNTASFDYCAIQGGEAGIAEWGQTLNWGEGNIDANPAFCDPWIQDYHLSAGSPCLNSGSDGSSIGALDQGCDELIIPDTTIGHWSMDETSDSTVLDISGNGLVGINHGATWTDGLYGDAVTLDSTEYVWVPYHPYLMVENAMTLEVICMVDSTDRDQVIVSRSTSSGLSMAINSDNHLVGDVWTNAGLISTDVPNIELLPDTWYHLALTISPSIMLLYVDHALVAGRPIVGPIVYTGATGLCIGGIINAQDNTFAHGFTGTIDEVRFSNRNLSVNDFLTFEPVSVSPSSQPTSRVMMKNYPNPFNPSTTISYALPEEVNVSLVIYDVRGQVVQTLESGHQNAGWYDVTWNGETADGHTISTGIYFARLVAGEYSQVIKMLYLK